MDNKFAYGSPLGKTLEITLIELKSCEDILSEMLTSREEMVSNNEEFSNA